MIAYIDQIAQSEGKAVTIRGWLHNRRSSGKIHFLSVRDGSGFIQAIVSKAAVGDEKFKQADHLSQETASDRARHGARRQPRTRRIRARRLGLRNRQPLDRLSDHAERARRRLPARSPPSLDSIREAGGDPSRAPRSGQRCARFLQRSRVHPCRHADFHAGRVRGHDDALSCRLLRGPESLSHAERTALRRSQRHGSRTRLQLRAGVPRGEVEDAPPPHRVLDGRARNGVCDA